MTVNKEWMRKVLWIYLAAMAVILFCSKTIYTQSIPQVTAALSHAGVLSKELTESGVAEYAETVGVYAMSVPWRKSGDSPFPGERRSPPWLSARRHLPAV